MRLTGALFGSLCLVEYALAASPVAVEGLLHRRHVDVHSNPLARRAARPQAPAPSSTQSATDALNSWNAKAEAACMSQMTSLGGTVQNPTGMAVCYNVPFMDSKSGVFEAELRVYTISQPTAEFVGVTAKEMMVSLAYLGATVQRTNGTMLAQMPNEPAPARREISEAELNARAELEKRQAQAPQELAVLTYVGQMNSNVKGPNTNNTEIQNLLIPEIELSAMNPTSNQKVQTILSSSNANFMQGIFNQASTNTISPAATASASALANNLMPFEIPGIRPGIPLIGLVVTCAWLGLFVIFVGLGTVGRYQFREQYHRNIKREQASGFKTI